MIDFAEKMKIAMLKQKTTQKELAARTNQTQGNISQKLLNNSFKLTEYQQLVEALGCTLEVNIILPSGEKI